MMFHPTDPSLFFSKNDAADPRLGDSASAIEANEIAERLRARPMDSGRVIALAGYADDEGIRLNGGRLGAALAPPLVRRHLYKMTPPALGAPQTFFIWDVGDLRPGDETLGERHERARHVARDAMAGGAFWLAIGGGHDYGFADAAAFADACAGESARPLLINFDAHLDVRPPTSGFSSGTPFSRWLDAFPASDFAEVGLQAQCNSRAHLEWLRARGGRTLFLEECEASGRSMVECAGDLLGEWAERRRPAYLSVDIDAFSNAWAPGCSQSFATGLTPEGFFPLFDWLLKRLDVRGVSVYETSPPLDEGERTSRLAALILRRACFPL